MENQMRWSCRNCVIQQNCRIFKNGCIQHIDRKLGEKAVSKIRDMFAHNRTKALIHRFTSQMKEQSKQRVKRRQRHIRLVERRCSQFFENHIGYWPKIWTKICERDGWHVFSQLNKNIDPPFHTWEMRS